MGISSQSVFGTQRCALSYAFKGRIGASDTAKTGFREARETILGDLCTLVGAQLSSFDVCDEAIEWVSPEVRVSVVDLSCRNRWGYRMISPGMGAAQTCDELTIDGSGKTVEVYFTRHQLVETDRVVVIPEAPAILAAALLKLGFGDGMKCQPRAVHIPNEEWVKWLWNFIQSRDRLMTITLVVDAQPALSFDAASAAAKGLGFCHVIVLPQPLVETFRRLKPRTCDCEIRDGVISFVYPAWCLAKGRSHWAMSFAQARKTFVEQQLAERGLDLSPAVATDDQLFDQCFAHNVSVLTVPQGLISYPHVVKGISLIKRPKEPELQKRIADLETSLGEVQKARETTVGDVETWQALCGELEESNRGLKTEVDELKRQLAEARGEQQRLRDLLWEQKPDIALRTIEYPDNYDPMAIWCEHHLAGKLVLHPRAVRELKDAQYREVVLVYKALQLLANEYRSMRLAKPSESKAAKRAFAEGTAALHLAYTATDSAAHAFDGYDIEYPVGSGRKYTMECHLKRGKTFDPTTCLRIYFVWDPEERVVVVGSLPKHLPNTKT